MALELARRGARVIVNYATSDISANDVVQAIKKFGGDAVAIKANVSDVSQIEKLFREGKERFGRLDIVCSNSGVVSFGHVKDVTPEEYDRVFNINTRGQFFVAREAYKNLEVGGRLILMGSITGQAKGVPKHAVYSASKGAIETFVRCMAIGACLSLLVFQGSMLTKDARLWRQEDHRQRRRSRRYQDGHVPRRVQGVYPRRRQARQRGCR